VDPADVTFPGATFAATRVRVRLAEVVEIGTPDRRASTSIEAEATAEISPSGDGGFPSRAAGGGYSGPLAYRQGEPMRPDVALAFDRMAAAAAREAGLSLIVTSGFRSDAEQARLFAAHPDPKWVAPPGESLHRYATELDLGPEAAYGWLAAEAGRFGFLKRYSWEPWHFGFEGGPPPCSDAGDSVLALAGDRDDAEAVGSLERDFLAVGRPLGRLPLRGGDAADSLSVRAHDEDSAPVAVARECDLLSVRRPVRRRVGGREVDLDPAPVVRVRPARHERKHRGGDGSHRGESAHDVRRRRNGRSC